MTDDEKVNIREVQTAKIRWKNDTAIVRATKAIRETGLEEGSFRFDPGAADEIGMLPAFGFEDDVDGRSEPLARPIYREGDGNTLVIGIPLEGLEALGIDPDDTDWESPPEVSVWAGDRLLAFERADERIVSIDRDESGESDDSNDETAPDGGVPKSDN